MLTEELTYILSSDTNGMPDNNLDIWRPSADPTAILSASQVVFAESVEEAMSKISALYPVKTEYPLLFGDGIVTPSYGRNSPIQVNKEKIRQLDENISVKKLTNKAYFEEFCRFVKTNKHFDYNDHPSEHDRNYSNFGTSRFSDSIFKKLLNEQGIYVRTTKKILEYNPKLAARQLKILLNAKDPKKKKKANITGEQLSLLIYNLQRFINANAPIIIVEGYERNKESKSNHIVALIDLISHVLTPPTFYRTLDSFIEIKRIWKKLDKNGRKAYAPNFCKFMDIETAGCRLPTAKMRKNRKLFKRYYAK